MNLNMILDSFEKAILTNGQKVLVLNLSQKPEVRKSQIQGVVSSDTYLGSAGNMTLQVFDESKHEYYEGRLGKEVSIHVE